MQVRRNPRSGPHDGRQWLPGAQQGGETPLPAVPLAKATATPRNASNRAFRRALRVAAILPDGRLRSVASISARRNCQYAVFFGRNPASGRLADWQVCHDGAVSRNAIRNAPCRSPVIFPLKDDPKFGLRPVELIFAGECFYRFRSLRGGGFSRILDAEIHDIPGELVCAQSVPVCSE